MTSRSHEPLFSIIVCVRNGMPYVKEAVQSIFDLEYSNYQVVVQDAASTDGTWEYLRQFEALPNWSLVSERDNGIGQGFNRALQRCGGDIICAVDADNRLYPRALSLLAAAWAEVPDAAVIYGHCGMIDSEGGYVQDWVPPHFDLLDLMDGTLVPPFASSFFSRQQCGEALRFDETMPIVADFDLWLRLSPLRIEKLASAERLVDVRIGKMSSTWTKETYDQQCSLKVAAMRRFLDGPSGARALEALFERCRGGLYLWGVDSMAVIGAGEDSVARYFAAALAADIKSERFLAALARTSPKLPAVGPGVVARIYDLGLSCLRRFKYEDALLYFELLRRSGYDMPGLTELIDDARSKTNAAQIELRDDLLRERVEHLQSEVNRRDDHLRELERHLQGEVNRRDEIIDELRATLLRRESRVGRIASRIAARLPLPKALRPDRNKEP